MTIHNTRSGRVQRRKEIPEERKNKEEEETKTANTWTGRRDNKRNIQEGKQIKGSKKKKLKEGCTFGLKTNRLGGKQTQQ